MFSSNQGRVKHSDNDVYCCRALPGVNAAAVGLIVAAVLQLGLKVHANSPFPDATICIGMPCPRIACTLLLYAISISYQHVLCVTTMSYAMHCHQLRFKTICQLRVDKQ